MHKYNYTLQTLSVCQQQARKFSSPALSLSRVARMLVFATGNQLSWTKTCIYQTNSLSVCQRQSNLQELERFWTCFSLPFIKMKLSLVFLSLAIIAFGCCVADLPAYCGPNVEEYAKGEGTLRQVHLLVRYQIMFITICCLRTMYIGGWDASLQFRRIRQKVYV